MSAEVRVRRLVVTATMVVAGLVLAGCSGGLEPPVPLPTGTATPTVTPTATPTVTPTVTSPPSAPPSAPPDARVAVRDNVFEPEITEVVVGQTVTWVWEGDVAHDVVGDGIDSGDLTKGATFSHRFTTAGSYAYVCTIHNGMDGRIDVKAAT